MNVRASELPWEIAEVMQSPVVPGVFYTGLGAGTPIAV